MTTTRNLGLGLSLPLIQAPMAGVQDHRLAVAVSRAGGLGSLPAAMLGPDALRAELAALAAHPGLAFNINFFCHRPPAADAAGQARWLDLLAGYYAALGVDPAGIPSGPARLPFDEATADLLESQAWRPAVVSFHFGLPSPALVDRVKQLGAHVFSSATTVDEALWLQDHGADAVIAQGIEAGGHRGHFLSDDLGLQGPTLDLVDALAGRLALPLIAAGGIATAADVAAVLNRGAAAAQIGTAFLLCPEARTTPLHRAALKAATGEETAITNLFTGRPARGIVNRLIRELGPIQAAAPAFPLAANAIGPLRTAAEARGSSDFTPLWSGTRPSGCRELPAGDLARQLAGGSCVVSGVSS